MKYLATVPADRLSALEKLRKTIKATCRTPEECISCSMPTLRLEGQGLRGGRQRKVTMPPNMERLPGNRS